MKKGQNHTFGQGQHGAAIAVRVVPTNGKTKLAGTTSEGQIKVNLNRSGEDENSQLIKFLANILQIDPSNIEIVAGLEKRDKLVAITGIDPDRIQALL